MKNLEKTMKKTKIIVGIILILAIMISLYPKSYADKTPTLEEIVRLFTNSDALKEYHQNNVTKKLYITSSKSDPEKEFADILTVHVQENNVTIANLEYKLEGNILTGVFSGSTDIEETEKIGNYWPMVTNILIGCIEIPHGYWEEEMNDTLNSSQVVNYRLEKEGLQIINKAPKYYFMQIDISKKIPTIDENSYIKVEDLKEKKENLVGESEAEGQKGNVIFYKCTTDDKDIISIGEIEKFSYKINKSIYSILEVMLESSDAVDYYKENYPKVGENKQFEGFKIEVNPIKNSKERYKFGVDDTYKFVRITVDREAINTALENAKKKEEEEQKKAEEEKGKEDDSESSSTKETEISSTKGSAATTGNQSSSTGTLPKTGEDDNIVLISLYTILILAWGGIMVISAKTKKKRN